MLSLAPQMLSLAPQMLSLRHKENGRPLGRPFPGKTHLQITGCLGYNEVFRNRPISGFALSGVGTSPCNTPPN